METLNLAYGNSSLSVKAAGNVHTISPAAGNQDVLADSSIKEALKNFILQLPIRPTDTVCIVVNDKTRKCGTERILPVSIKMLEAKGIGAERIEVLVAAGAHESVTLKGSKAFLGDLPERIDVMLHDCRSEDDLVYIGETSFGTRVGVNRLAVESDCVISISGISYHYFAGYGGGVKSLVPGCAAHETIMTNHALTLSGDSPGLHPGCRAGNIKGNPVYEDLLEAYGMLGETFGVISGLTEAGEIAELFTGSLIDAHAEARNWLDDNYSVSVRNRGEAVVASCGGYPHDINLVQAHKCLRSAARITRDGGRILFAAECADGLGSSAIQNWLTKGNSEDIKSAAKADYAPNAQTVVSLKALGENYRIGIITSLDADVVDLLGFTKLNPENGRGISAFMHGVGDILYLPSAYSLKLVVDED